MKKLSQRDRVLLALKRYPRVSVTDFLAPAVVDGGKPITRLAARINELRDEGYAIEDAGRVHGCSSYRLAPVVEEPVPASVHLFDPRDGSNHRRSHWQDEAA
jgi:hypothetical protein